MANVSPDRRVKAVLGPTNTGKTHLAIERLCAHSSGAIGFPLRLLAREVYDRVCAIKGASRVALITGEERIEPPDARWLLCTAEAMPVVGRELAFVALDEAQLAADRERGHIFTDRLLNARGREETMILGSATLEPMVRALVPEAEIVSRPRFSTLSHSGARKLSRIPPRSAIVAFSAEQVYAVAELLRRFRGGAAVVMGALSPETRNKQVALYQSGEVDYLVATDAVGMGLNLDVTHVAFAGLSKYDGVRQRRLTTAEMAQIAGRAGRHQRDGTFGTLSGSGHEVEFSDDEVYAIEQHRFPPLTKLFWREAEPRCDDLATLIGDLVRPPTLPELTSSPEAVDLAVLRRLAEDPATVATLRTPGQVRRFWEVCSLPDFRQQGAETHSRFVARLWSDLAHGPLGLDMVAGAIAQLDNVSGDIDTLQGRISAIRSWAYIAQRPDWLIAREEMAARARAVEARLSDALHSRLTERFVNRRTSVLMRGTGQDTRLLSVQVEDGSVLVEGEAIGTLTGFRFRVDPAARASDRKLLLAAAERHLPALLAAAATRLAGEIDAGTARLDMSGLVLLWEDDEVARIERGRTLLDPRIRLDSGLHNIPEAARLKLEAALEQWLAAKLAPLAPLRRLAEASLAREGGPELRALLIRLVDAGGAIAREGSGIDRLAPEQRERLRRLGVKIGALDIFLPAMLKPAAAAAANLLPHGKSRKSVTPLDVMPPVLPATPGLLPSGYRRAGQQPLRIDMAEKLLHAAHRRRTSSSGREFVLDPSLATSMGLTTANYARLLRDAGFKAIVPRELPDGAFGPAAPARWRWQPNRREGDPPSAPAGGGGAFAGLAELVA